MAGYVSRTSVAVVVAALAWAAAPARASAQGVWTDAWSRTPLSTTVTTSHTAVQGTTPAQFKNQTFRLVAYTTMGGSRISVKLTNAFSTTPLAIGAAHVALRQSGGTIAAGTDRTLLFGGSPSVTLAAGAERWSDPVTLTVGQHVDVAISLYLPGAVTPTGFHPTGLKTSYLSRTGNFTGASTMPAPSFGTRTTTMVFFVSEIQVLADGAPETVVALGDSITDGACSNIDTNGDWPSLLSKRLPALPAGNPVSVVIAGIGSNRFATSDGAGLRGLLRLPELLARPNVRWVILLEGVNDISYEHALPDDLIAAYQSAIDEAHAAGIKIIGVPILPIKHSVKDVGGNEVAREAVNAWIRTSGAFDRIIDFEPALADPADPLSLQASLTCDHVHPNQAGYRAMANAIDLTIFQ